MAQEVIQLAVGGFDDNFAYVLRSGGEAAVIDPAARAEKILDALGEARLRYVLLTHRHPDHAGALEEVLARRPAPVPERSGSVVGEILPLGETRILVIPTPGHSPDSVCYLAGNALFTGDTLFVDCVGFGVSGKLYESLGKLKALPDDTLVYPGHDYGRTPTSTIGREKLNNPFLRCDTPEEFKRLHRKLR